MPRFDTGKRWSLGELQKAATLSGTVMMPIGDGVGNFGYIRAEDGFGVHAVIGLKTQRIGSSSSLTLAKYGQLTPTYFLQHEIRHRQ